MKKKTPLIALAAILLFLPAQIFAAVIFDHTNTWGLPYTNYTFGAPGQDPAFFQPFSAGNWSISQINLQGVYNAAGCSSPNISVALTTATSDNEAIIAANTLAYFTAESFAGCSSNPNDFIYKFDNQNTTTTLSSGTTYYIYIKNLDGLVQDYNTVNDPKDSGFSPIKGVIYNFNNGFNSYNWTTRFQLEGTGGGGGSNISFWKPLDNSTSTIDLTYFGLSYGFSDGVPVGGTSTPEIGSIEVDYGVTSTPFDSSSTENVFVWLVASSTVPKLALNPGTYYAQASLFDASSTFQASSPIISWTYESPYAIPTSTLPSTGSCAGLNGVQWLGCWAFVPRTNYFNSTWDLFFSSIQNGITIYYKPPFGYFGSIKATVSSLTATASSTFSYPDLSWADPAISPLRGGITMVLWLIGSVYGFKRLAHLNFTSP